MHRWQHARLVPQPPPAGGLRPRAQRGRQGGRGGRRGAQGRARVPVQDLPRSATSPASMRWPSSPRNPCPRSGVSSLSMRVSIERPNIAKRGIPGRCILSVLGSQNNEQAMLCGTLQGCMQSGMASIALSVTHMHHDRRATPLQVLMLDSDNLPLRNPEYLFRTPQYQGGGSLFFQRLVGHCGVGQAGGLHSVRLRVPRAAGSHAGRRVGAGAAEQVRSTLLMSQHSDSAHVRADLCGERSKASALSTCGQPCRATEQGGV